MDEGDAARPNVEASFAPDLSWFADEAHADGHSDALLAPTGAGRRPLRWHTGQHELELTEGLVVDLDESVYCSCWLAWRPTV